MGTRFARPAASTIAAVEAFANPYHGPDGRFTSPGAGRKVPTRGYVDKEPTGGANGVTVPAGTEFIHVTRRPNWQPVASERGESGPGMYVTKGKPYRTSDEHDTFNEHRMTTNRPLRLLDRSTPAGEDEFRTFERDPSTGKMNDAPTRIRVAKAAGYDGISYPGATGTEQEYVIFDPKDVTLRS